MAPLTGLPKDPIVSLRLTFYVTAAILLVTLGLTPSTDTVSSTPPYHRVGELWHFFVIGIIAATVANSTGAGGGIVFLPAFTTLGFSLQESLATSFAIQCFGMTAGALTWTIHLRQNEPQDIQRESFLRIFLVTAAASIVGLRGAQHWLPDPAVNIKWLFSIFSLIVGGLLLHRTLRKSNLPRHRDKPLSDLELTGLAGSCLIGGAITAWLSIGVGEILAIHLLALRFRVNLAVAAAVCVTSVTVISALPHFVTDFSIQTGVLTFAAPGALIGGTLARRLAILLGGLKLKIAMALWIILTAVVYLIV